MQSDDVKQEEHTVESELTSTPSNIDNIYMIIKKRSLTLEKEHAHDRGLNLA